ASPTWRAVSRPSRCRTKMCWKRRGESERNSRGWWKGYSALVEGEAMAQRRKGNRATAEQRDCQKARLPDGATAKRRKRPSAEERATLNGTLLPKRRR